MFANYPRLVNCLLSWLLQTTCPVGLFVRTHWHKYNQGSSLLSTFSPRIIKFAYCEVYGWEWLENFASSRLCIQRVPNTWSREPDNNHSEVLHEQTGENPGTSITAIMCFIMGRFIEPLFHWYLTELQIPCAILMYWPHLTIAFQINYQHFGVSLSENTQSKSFLVIRLHEIAHLPSKAVDYWFPSPPFTSEKSPHSCGFHSNHSS